jgi:hypothetical protein
MSNRKIKISPEYSAQRRSHPPNPALVSAIEALKSFGNGTSTLGRVADLGCGKLRHYDLLSTITDTLYLVDTPKQISKTHVDGGTSYTIPQVVEQSRREGRRVHVLCLDDFSEVQLDLDVVFCIAVFDVVPRKTRQALTRVAVQNLSEHGHFVVIAPRNDSSILRRCSKDNKYMDGHVFKHHGVQTFFHNFRSHRSIVHDCAKEGLSTVQDLSRYRQVCLIFGHSVPKWDRKGI